MIQDNFLTDIIHGLSGSPKTIPSKYIYSAVSSETWNSMITRKEYYPFYCELEILNTFKNEIMSFLLNKNFNLIELGSGDGKKTEILIDYFVKKGLNFGYYPVDISRSFLEKLVVSLQKYKTLFVKPIEMEFDRKISFCDTLYEKSLVLFLGASFGNFIPDKGKTFLLDLWSSLHHNDYFLIGFDLIKDVDILNSAYNDERGYNDTFTFSVLNYINQKLAANFDAKKFKRYCYYNIKTRAIENWLVSTKKQNVYLGKAQKEFSFDLHEGLCVEHSYKFTICEIEKLAINSGFVIEKHFFDSKKYYVNSLWRVTK